MESIIIQLENFRSSITIDKEMIVIKTSIRRKEQLLDYHLVGWFI